MRVAGDGAVVTVMKCVILSGGAYAPQSNPAGVAVSTMRHPERRQVSAAVEPRRGAVRRDLGLDVSTPLCLE